MNKPVRKNRLSPLEVAKLLKLSPAKFSELVADGQLPKGRVGDDGRRFYTQQDVEFILREWKTQTTGRFLMYTLPLMLVMVFLIILTVVEIKEKITESRVSPTPTAPFGFGAPPPQYYAPGTEWPTPTPAEIPTPVYETIENYRQQMIQQNQERNQQRMVTRDDERPQQYMN